jgi:predicted RNase H-like HicB family nuclease
MKLRILGESRGSYWVATCLEFNLVTEGKDFPEACDRMNDALEGYLKVVFDTDDPLSIPSLIKRPAPRSKFWKFAIAERLHRLRSLKADFLNPPRFSLHAQMA